MLFSRIKTSKTEIKFAFLCGFSLCASKMFTFDMISISFSPMDSTFTKWHCFSDIGSNQISLQLNVPKMSVEVERKVNCGVWTALELLITKGSNSSIWDKKETQSKPVTARRREKIKIRYECRLICTEQKNY